MSPRKKQKDIITNRQLYERLYRLGWHKVKPAVFLAYVALQLVNKGDVVPMPKAVRCIKKYNMDKTLGKIGVPTINMLEGLIYITIYKRELCKTFIDNPKLPIWEDQLTAPIFDIIKDIMKVYKL